VFPLIKDIQEIKRLFLKKISSIWFHWYDCQN